MKEKVKEILRQFLIRKFSMWHINDITVDELLEEYTDKILKVYEEKE